MPKYRREVPLDPRSTGRKRGRKVLFESGRRYACIDCGRGPLELPKDAPIYLDLAPVELQVEGLALQCDHENKNILDNDPVNLNWRCPPCHKLADNQTAKGVSRKGDDEYGYGTL